MDKALFRNRLKQQRNKLSLEEVKKYSRQITGNCLAIVDWPNIQSIHTYLAISKNNEIDTRPLISLARQSNPDVKIASWDAATAAAKAKWLDTNLKPAKDVPANFQYGLIIVPLLAFDTRGHRLGYGGGFYDRFLSNQDHALKIGLCYEFGHLPKLPAEDHDVPLNLVITEEKIYKV